MRISGVGTTPYIYNTSRVSSASLNKISGIDDDVTSQKTDFTGLTDDANENPLKMGESKNFMDIIASQMAMSQSNAARLVPNAPSADGAAAGDMMQQNQNTQDVGNMQDVTQVTA